MSKTIKEIVSLKVFVGETETHSKQKETLRLVRETSDKDQRDRNEIKECPIEEAFLKLRQSTKSAFSINPNGLAKMNLESTYQKDYVHPYPELLYKKSKKQVSIISYISA
jgi:hypothetical protein